MHKSPGRHSRVDPPAHSSSAASWTEPVNGHPHAGIGDQLFPPLDPWDPAEELAYLLQEATEAEASAAPPAAGIGESTVTTVTAVDDDPLAGLTQITAELPPVRPSSPGRRRARSRKRTVGALQTMSFFLAALAAVVVSMVCVFGGMVSYDPLRHLAKYRTTGDTVSWWPLLVYGPWMVASLSILRAALHQRRAVHSWAVVLLFSTVSMLLCVAQAPHTPVDAAAAALPSLAALACFQQIVRQITLTRPPRQAAPRHRNPASSPQRSISQNGKSA